MDKLKHNRYSRMEERVEKIYLITRADDAGSSHSANQAIKEAAGAGFIKNISVMAPGPYVEEAAYLLAGHKEICFGLHTAFHAEWDRVKWGPVGSSLENSGLLDENRQFLSHPDMWAGLLPDPENIIKEMDAQLEKVHKAGFAIRYADSHMFWEDSVVGMREAFADWTEKKGLCNHAYYYNFIEGIEDSQDSPQTFLKALSALSQGQYFYLAHPAFDSKEMRLTGNQKISGEKIARDRDREARLLKDTCLLEQAEKLGIKTIRYDEAVRINQPLHP